MSVPKSARVKNSCTAGPRWLANGNALAKYGKRFTADKRRQLLCTRHPKQKAFCARRKRPLKAVRAASDHSKLLVDVVVRFARCSLLVARLSIESTFEFDMDLDLEDKETKEC